MAPRIFWKGYLKLSLVTCPVAMSPATGEGEKVRFHTLNRATGNRVVSRYVDSITHKPVAEDDEVNGYERGEGEYVLLEDDEIDSVALESTRTIDIDTFVPKDSVGWIWYDTPHYLVSNDKVGEEAFAVIRDAMANNDVVGISRLVLYRRERAVLLEPRDKGIVVWTLRYGDEVRDADDYFPTRAEKPEKAHLDLMYDFIRKHTRTWKPELVDDPVQDRLLDIIAARKKHRAPARTAAKSAEPEKPTNVVNIMDALRRSLKQK